jgi:CBS domain containing-hemolysin-like protein
MLVFVLAVASALVFSFLCSVSEAVLLSVGHAQVEKLGKSKAGMILRRFKREIDVPLAAILVLNTVANTAGAAVAGASYGLVFDESTVWIFSLAFTVAVLLFTEILPKTLGVTFAPRLVVPVTVGVSVLIVLLKPVLFLTRQLSSLLRRGHRRPVTSVEEIRLLAALGRTEGALTARTADLIKGVTLLRELTAYDVMVPRDGVVCLSAQDTLQDNLRRIKRSGHSRFPFTADGNLDNVQGVILTKDLMFQLHENPGKPDYDRLLGTLVVVPGATPLDRLLRKFQEERRHLALIVDEYGGMQGIVTLEDVLEEIVGEIEDESDRLDPSIARRPNGSLVCRGWAETRKVFALLGIEEESDMVSIGGLVAHLLDRVPRRGDSVRWKDHEFLVLRASPRRAERVEVRPLGPVAE